MKLFSQLALASLAVAGKAKKNKSKVEKTPPFSFGDLTCTTEHIPVLFDLAKGVQIVRNTNKKDGSREFLLGCDETMTEPNYNVITCKPEIDGKADGTGMVGIEKLVAEKWIDRDHKTGEVEITTAKISISCIPLGTGSSEGKCTEDVLRKELKAQLDYKFALTHAFKNAEINCQIDLKKQQKEQKKKNKAARSEAGIGARKGGKPPKNPEKALKKNKKKAEKASKKADKKAKKQNKKKDSQGKHPVTTKIPKKEFEFSDLDMNVVSIEGEAPTDNPLKGMPLYLECDGVPYFPDKENKNEAYYWRPSRDSPVKETAWFNC